MGDHARWWRPLGERIADESAARSADFYGGKNTPAGDNSGVRRARLGTGIGVAGLLLAIGATVGISQAQAAAPTIVNNAAQERWVESDSIPGEGSTGNRFRFTLVVQHDLGQVVDTVLVDDNYDNNTFDTVAVTAQQATVVGGQIFSRVTVTTTPQTGGFSCPLIGTRTRRRDDQYQVRARTVDNQETQTLSFNMHRVANGTCVGADDFPYIYDQTQNKTSVELGGTADDTQFQFRGTTSTTPVRATSSTASGGACGASRTGSRRVPPPSTRRATTTTCRH